VRHARELIYADGVDLGNLDAAVPIGVTCRLCERMDCRQRAFPPLQRGLEVDENVRGLSFYVAPGGGEP
jgi:predicted transcriptional regulator